ncbi:unnamed protein product, partial [Brassica oleracea]
MASDLRLVLIISFVSVLVFSTSSSPLPRFPRQNRARIQLFGGDRNSYQYETKYFSQQLDHFSFADLPKFSQRYLINSDHWTGASELGPIFLYCGNEGDIEWFATNSGFIWEIAPKFGALLVFPEHRYYGESMPYGSRDEAYKNATTLSYLTTEQALADFAVFVTDLKRNLSAEASPVVLFGGSYGGMLAAWMRLKYPHIAIGALASSAPILQFEDIVPPQTFYDIVSNDFKRESSTCFNTIKNSWDAIIAEGQKENGLQQLSKTFHFCRALNSTDDLSDWLDSAYSYLAMVDYPYPADFMMPLPGHPIKEVCRKIDGASSDASILERIYAGVSVYYNYTGKVGCFELDDDPHGLDGWNWQACTEMVMPMSSSQENSMFTAYDFNYSSYKEDCWNTFGVNPRPRWVTTELGGHDIETALKSFGSNIIFSNGLLDPWSGGSVLKNLSSTIVALVTEEGGHHLDLRPSTPEDPKWLVEQREAEIGLIQGWIRTYRLEKEAQFPLLKRSWESSLLEKEQELLVAEEKIASKESKVLANQEVILRKRKSDVEAELESKCKLAEDEIESKRRAWELREVDIKQKEDLVGEKEHDLEVQSRILAEKEKDITERSYSLDEEEKHLNATEEDISRKTNLLENEKERLRKLDSDLQQALISLEDKRKRVDSATEKLEALKSETSELSILEMKLKEELDDMRGQKLELLAEADRMKVEKAKFEAEWEHIDVKREELRKEAEYITRQREAFSMYLKDERDNIREERDALRNQHKNDVEALNREREEFMNKMVEEHSEWLGKIQRERADFLLGIETQKRELEYCIENRREELENSSREREKAFEQEKNWEKVSALKQKVVVTRDEELDLQNGISTVSNSKDGYNSNNGSRSPSSATPFSWIKQYTNLIFKNPPETSLPLHHHEEGALPSEKREEKAYTEGMLIAVEKLEAGKKRRGNASGNDTSEPSSHKKRKQEVTQKSSDEADPESVISSPQNVPEDKHELPSNQTQAPPSGMVVLSEIVKITKVTCETEVINKVSNIECSDDPSEAGTKMVEEEKQDSDCNQVGFFQHTNPLESKIFLITS